MGEPSSDSKPPKRVKDKAEEPDAEEGDYGEEYQESTYIKELADGTILITWVFWVPVDVPEVPVPDFLPL